MKWKALRTSLFLSALFVGVYGACNQVTALRGDVGTLYLPFERFIPFVPAMIVPYMSIDLFFVIAPFLCGTGRELVTYRRRIAACILIAGACFLLFPMKFSFPRPEVGGVLGVVFNNFRKMDLPFNEFPSLHIALRAVMIGVYARHTRGLLRAGLHVWFSLIGVSTVLVYQHHLIDIAGGFVLAGVVNALFQERPGEGTRNPRVGGYYLAGMTGLTALAWWLRPVGVLLLWPAAACGLAAAGYFGMGPGIYRKRGGRVGAWAWLAAWPVLVGQWASWGYYARKSRAWDVLSERVWIGRQLLPGEAREAVAAGVTAVVDLTGEFTAPAAFRGARHLSLPVLDLTAPTMGQLREAVAFIERESAGGIVYVHCKAGYSRTAAVAGAWLLETGRAGTAAEAAALLRRARPGMVIRPEAMAALEEFAGARGAVAATVS